MEIVKIYLVGCVCSWAGFYILRKLAKSDAPEDNDINFFYGIISWIGLIVLMWLFVKYIILGKK